MASSVGGAVREPEDSTPVTSGAGPAVTTGAPDRSGSIAAAACVTESRRYYMSAAELAAHVRLQRAADTGGVVTESRYKGVSYTR